LNNGDVPAEVVVILPAIRSKLNQEDSDTDDTT